MNNHGANKFDKLDEIENSLKGTIKAHPRRNRYTE